MRHLPSPKPRTQSDCSRPGLCFAAGAPACDQANRSGSRHGGSSVAIRIGRFSLVDDNAPPHVPVDRAPVRHHVNPVAGRMRFDYADLQRPRAPRACRRLHDTLQPPSARMISCSSDKTRLRCCKKNRSYIEAALLGIGTFKAGQAESVHRHDGDTSDVGQGRHGDHTREDPAPDNQYSYVYGQLSKQ